MILFIFAEVYEETEDGEKVICHTELPTEEILTFPEEVVRVIASFTEEFKRIGNF